MYGLGQTGVVTRYGDIVAVQFGQTHLFGNIQGTHRILGVVGDGDGAAVEEAGHGDVAAFGRGVGVDLFGEVRRGGVGHRRAGRQDFYLVALPVRIVGFFRAGDDRKFGAVARLGAPDADFVAHCHLLGVFDENGSRLLIVADDESLVRHGHYERRRNLHGGLVVQCDHVADLLIFGNVAEFVADLRDEHLGTAGERPSLENEFRLAGIVHCAVAHVLGDRNRDVHDAGSFGGGDGHPIGDLRHPVGRRP